MCQRRKTVRKEREKNKQKHSLFLADEPRQTRLLPRRPQSQNGRSLLAEPLQPMRRHDVAGVLRWLLSPCFPAGKLGFAQLELAAGFVEGEPVGLGFGAGRAAEESEQPGRAAPRRRPRSGLGELGSAGRRSAPSGLVRWREGVLVPSQAERGGAGSWVRSAASGRAASADECGEPLDARVGAPAGILTPLDIPRWRDPQRPQNRRVPGCQRGKLHRFRATLVRS